jgi:micrococcal nuclease
MNTLTLCRIAAIVLFLSITIGATGAAERKEWVTLTNCQYMAAKYNDGDSFRVRSGTNEFTLRLYFVDAPETTLTYPERTRQQSEHFGITLDEALKAGARASERTRELLQQPFVVRTRWASAAGRGRETRYYGLVEVGDKSLAEVLVGEGLAQAKGVAPNLPSGEKATAYRKRLEDLEGEARQKRLGAWATSAVQKTEGEIRPVTDGLVKAGLGTKKFLKKPLASCFAFDIFFAPLRPKDGTDSMIADR